MKKRKGEEITYRVEISQFVGGEELEDRVLWGESETEEEALELFHDLNQTRPHWTFHLVRQHVRRFHLFSHSGDE